MRMTRASVLSSASLATPISSAPSPLMVAAKTGEPGLFGTGTDSPVIGA
jgi:hypothetical protein